MERKLVSLCFEIGMTIARESAFFADKTDDEVAEWIRNQLDSCGFKTIPLGSNWGYLLD